MSFGYSAGDFLAILKLANDLQRRFAQAPRQYKAITDEVESLSTVLHRIDGLDENDFNTQQQDEINKAILGCHNVSLELEATLNKFGVLENNSTAHWKDTVRRAWKRIRWDQAEIDNFRSRVVSNISLFNNVVSNISQDLVLEIRKDIKTLCLKQDYQERDQILDWLSSINPSTRQSEVFNSHHKGTGTWFLETNEFKEWISSEQQILFCLGIPGAGKTTLTSIIINHLEETFDNQDGIGLTYLFCDYRERPTLLMLLCALLRQFCQRQASIPDRVKSMYTSHVTKKTRPSEDEIFRELKSIIATSTRFFFIIDALDECPVSDGIASVRQTFLRQLVILSDQTGVNILATSRPNNEIAGYLQTYVSVEIQPSREDIRSYLDSRIVELPEFVQKRPSLKQCIKDGITEAARGMFLLVRLYFNLLLDQGNEKRVRNTIKKFSSGSHYNVYEHAYDETVRRIEHQSADVIELAKRTIGWITNAKSPLTVIQLEHALAIEINSHEFDESNITDIKQLSSYCCGLVIVDKQTDNVRLVHYTTQKYFENMWETWFPQIHEVITDSCLTYLSYDIFEENRLQPKLEFPGIQSEYPFFAYSAQNWGNHFREHPGNHSLALQYLQNEAKTFLSGCLGLSGSVGDTELPRSGVKGEHIAALFGLEYLMQRLLEANPLKTQTKDDLAWTPLHFTARYGHETVAKLLLEYGANLEALDRSGSTPLGFAAAYGQENVVRLLLDNGAKVESSDISGRTPLHSAAHYGHETVAKLLLDSGADIETSGRDGTTPLRLAAVFGNDAMAKLLLERGAYIESSDERGTSPLHIATRHGHETVVKLLLDFGANPGSPSSGPRPLPTNAVVNGHNAVVYVRDFPMFFVTS
ncbi:hypothetical protein CBS147332_6099 [Penicillium roqueforti]|nr:hypothetical protein CBS147332_6099 [Penicillium roqueforti]KAI3100580.1 hypothetical protein CBS147331_8165 [Penicillium roqueforti]